MSSGCGDVLSLADLQTAKKHQIFEAEVITGKSGGVAGGADIDYATNQVTGQTQKTLPAVLRDAGFSPVAWDFSTGGTLTVNDRDKVVYDPVSKTWYSYAGTLPVTVPAGFNPVGNADWKPQTDPDLRADLASSADNKGDALLTVKQPFTGAIARTMHSKNSDTLNVKDFGAIGDGVHDDTNSFQLAIDNAALNGGEVKLASGCIYRIDGVVQLKSNVHIDLSGCTILKDGSGSCFYAENINNFSVFNGRIYTSLSYPSNPPSVVQANNFGIGINKCSRFKISNLDIRGFGDCGIIVASSSASSSGEVVSYSTITECNVSYCYTGIKFIGYFPSEYISVTSCFGYKNNFAGCHVEAGNIYISASSFSTNSLYGLYLKSSDNGGHGNASGCSFNHNSGKNILIDSLQQGFMFSGCNIFDDAGPDPYSGMIQFAGCKGITFSGCQIMANIQADGLTASNQFVGCSFYGDRNYQVSSSDGTDGYIVFTNCIQGGGGFKRNLPGVNAIHAAVSDNYTTAASSEVLKFNVIGTYSGDKMLDVSTGIFVAKSTGLHTVSFRVECSSSFSITIVAKGKPHSKFTSSLIGGAHVCSGTTVIALAKNDIFNLAIEADVGSSIKNASNATIYV